MNLEALPIGEIVGWTVGGVGALVAFVWQLRPKAEKFVDGRVTAAVGPLLTAIGGVSAKLDVQEAERQTFHETTSTTLAMMTGSLDGLRNDVDRNTEGNMRGRDGINALGADVERQSVRTHELEIKTGLRVLGGAAADHANGAA